MSLDEIKRAMEALSPPEFAELAAFIRDLDNAAWDRQMEHDSASGKLDFLFEEATSRRACE